MEIDFYPLDIDGITHGQQAYIRMIGTTPKGKKVCVLDKNFHHYFYASLTENISTTTAKKIAKDIENIPGVHATAVEGKKHLAQPVMTIKISLTHPKELQNVKHQVNDIDDITGNYEIDLPYERRYLLDNNITPLTLTKALGTSIQGDMNVDIIIDADQVLPVNEDMIQPKILAFDIEVYNPYISPREQQDPVIMLALYGEKTRKVITWKNIKGKNIQYVKDEKALIEQFIQDIKEEQPDYLIGYFSDGFDLPYLKARAKKNKISLDLGLDGTEVNINRRAQTGAAKITGIAHIDIYKFIKRITSGGEIELESYDLDTVAKEMLGEGKHKIDIMALAKAWENDNEKELSEYAVYNLKDAELTYKLAEKMLPNLHEMVKLVGQNVYDIARMTFGQYVEWYLIKNVKHYNELVPNRPLYGEMEERAEESYEGAYVFEPLPGLYEDIIGFDFRSLYPSIIIAHNICVSTETTKGEGEPTPAIQEGKKSTHYYYTKKYEGFIPGILKDIVGRRARIKKMMKQQARKDPIMNARQYGLKILANSFYGYFGFSGARWYSNNGAASITAWARYYIQATIKRFEKEGFTTRYGDTDSLYLTLGKKKRNDAMKLMENINKELPEGMELELENYYLRGIFVMKKGGDKKGAKKKYALIDEKGFIKVRGFETIRGDWSVIARETQQRVLEIILKENNPQKAATYIRDIIKNVQQKKLSAEKMIIKKQLKKEIKDYDSIGPHVAVAQRMQERGMKIQAGAIIKFIVDEGKGMIRDRARIPDEAKSYDAEYYINHQILPAVQPLLDVLHIKEEELQKNHQQKGIMDY
ncbi:MAG TPA: DNA-directed DNA polymerase [Candidatus Nanoarchaeia archaeon]|nr:DNA-directed DNA polymerase [Candidatus Nanoarchaeia archaeon]